MAQKIDLTGFVCEDIELVIDDMTFNIPTDPDVESYILLLKTLNIELKAKELYEAQRDFIISLIINNNKDKEIDIDKLKSKLGLTAVENFIRPYQEILIEKGILKKVIPPKKREEKKSQSK